MPAKIRLYICLFLLLHGSYSFAVTPLVLNNTKDQFFTLSYEKIDVLIDKTKNIRFSDILKSSKDFQRVNITQTNKDGKYIFERGDNAAYWIRFTVINQGKEYKNWLIDFPDFNIDEISFYMPTSNGSYSELRAGSIYHFSERTFKHRNFQFNIPFSEKPLVCFIRIEPGKSSVFAAELKTIENFIAYSISEYYLLGLFYGFILLMGVYNLVLYISIREKQYLYYIFYVICIGLSSMCDDGTAFQYLWPQFPHWNENILAFSLFGIILWTLFYSKWFLNTRLNAPLISKAIDIILLIVMGLMIFVQVFSWDYTVFLIPAAAIPLLLIYITGIRIYAIGFRPVSYFLLAYTFFLMGFLIRALTFFNVIEGSILTVFSYHIAVLIETMLFSIAIGDKIRTIRLEKEKRLIEKEAAQQQLIYQLRENEILKDKVNRELETKIIQRTVELDEKNKKLQLANEKLNELIHKANQWNVMPDIDSGKLQENVKELAATNVLMKDLTPEEFNKIFPNENSCFQYLADLKWKEKYQCKKCSNDNYGKGKTLFSRRCTKCNYEESPTNGTLFHRLKFPINKAFYMVYLVSIKDPGITSDKLSEILTLRRETCWSFKKKITAARKNGRKINDHEMEGWTSILNYQISE